MSPLHVVVAGHGMVGDRFAAEVRRHDPAGRRVRLTILAAESRPAYNRVLLPNLLSGVMLEEDLMRNGRWRLPRRQLTPYWREFWRRHVTDMPSTSHHSSLPWRSEPAHG